VWSRRLVHLYTGRRCAAGLGFASSVCITIHSHHHLPVYNAPGSTERQEGGGGGERSDRGVVGHCRANRPVAALRHRYRKAGAAMEAWICGSSPRGKALGGKPRASPLDPFVLIASGLCSVTALRKTGIEETMYAKHQELKQASKQASATAKNASR